MDKQEYQIFDVSENVEKVSLKLTSNKNIKDVTEVLTQGEHQPFEERVYYAQIGEHEPKKINEDGNKVYEFENRYLSKGIWYAALAERLFYGTPKLVEMNDEDEAVVADGSEGLYNGLMRSEVRKGLENFLTRFGEKVYTEDGFLGFSMNDLFGNLTAGEIQNLTKRFDGLEESINDGAPLSQANTDSGN